MPDLSASFHFLGENSAFEREVFSCLSAAGIGLGSDLQPGGEADGVVCVAGGDEATLDQIRVLRARAPVQWIAVVSSEQMSSALTWRLVHAGASDVVPWIDPPGACRQIRSRLERWHTVRELAVRSCDEVRLIGSNWGWRSLVRRIVEVAHFSSSPILLTGESGTGKELLARLVHRLSPASSRSSPPDLVTVDCSTLSPELSGSELFGHERGAFTGAVNARDGAFALAHGGTLFLDEIGELPLPLQTQLLRAIQEKKYKRVGGNVWQNSDFRLVCATNRDLAKRVRRGRFRLDLYHRIAGWVFTTIPLRERRDDILPLADHFLRAIDAYARIPGFDQNAAEFLLTADYPGNVRELEHRVRRMALLHAGTGPITIGDIAEEDRPMNEDGRNRWPDAELEHTLAQAIAMGRGLREISQITSETAIRMAMQAEKGNLQRAARRLGITDRALQLRKASGRICA